MAAAWAAAAQGEEAAASTEAGCAPEGAGLSSSAEVGEEMRKRRR